MRARWILTVSIHGAELGRPCVPMSSACRTRLYLPLAPPCAYWTPPSLGDAVIEDYSAIDNRKTASRLHHRAASVRRVVLLVLRMLDNHPQG